ncbi:MAG: hypothetical protein FWG64_00850 [Firmicutes bacterium]|nr:hypothetical protein [Bacillota bacterium]
MANERAMETLPEGETGGNNMTRSRFGGKIYVERKHEDGKLLIKINEWHPETEENTIKNEFNSAAALDKWLVSNFGNETADKIPMNTGEWYEVNQTERYEETADPAEVITADAPKFFIEVTQFASNSFSYEYTKLKTTNLIDCMKQADNLFQNGNKKIFRIAIYKKTDRRNQDNFPIYEHILRKLQSGGGGWNYLEYKKEMFYNGWQFTKNPPDKSIFTTCDECGKPLTEDETMGYSDKWVCEDCYCELEDEEVSQQLAELVA